MEQCSGCRFWLNWDSEFTNLGECHRFPPRMANVRETGAEGPVRLDYRTAIRGFLRRGPIPSCSYNRRLPPARVSRPSVPRAKPDDLLIVAK